MDNKCKHEIKNYIQSQGWLNRSLFNQDDSITMSYFTGKYCKKGVDRSIREKWNDNRIKLEKHFLDYIGHILRKHNVKEVSIGHILYSSPSWKFKDINPTLI